MKRNSRRVKVGSRYRGIKRVIVGAGIEFEAGRLSDSDWYTHKKWKENGEYRRR